MDEQTVETMRQVMQVADRFTDAVIRQMDAVAKLRADAQLVRESLPENPKRGSYYWWAQICREYTGSNLVDSGGIYGYQYQRGVMPEDGPHMWLTLWQGKPEYWQINTIMWLATMLEADDEIAIALEEVLDWAGEWLMPRENWYKLTSDMGAILNMLYACIWETGKVDHWRYSTWIKDEKKVIRCFVSNTLEDGKLLVKLNPRCAEYVKYGVPFLVKDKRPHGTRFLRATPVRYDGNSSAKTIFRKIRNRMNGPHILDVHDWAEKGEVGTWIFAEQIVRMYHGKLYYKSDFKDYQWPMSINQYVEQALAELPVDAVKLLHENGVKKSEGGYYTYGKENNLSQDIHFDLAFQDDYGDSYVIVRTHNGSDARWGFSSPVVAKAADIDYLYDCQVTGYCTECNAEVFPHLYPKPKEPPDDPPIEEWRSFLAEMDAKAAGQMLFVPDRKWEWADDYYTARAVIEYMDAAEDGEERDFPHVIAVGEEGLYAVDSDGGYETLADVEIHGIRCPACGSYNVGFWSSVYGF